MSDSRLTPANERVAAERLRGQVEAPHFSEGAARHLLVPVADVMNAPSGKRERQVVSGENLTSYEDHEGWSFVELERDGYVGYVISTALAVLPEPTHYVSARAPHLYTAADFKSPEITALSHLSRLRVVSEAGRFVETPLGYIPRAHISPIGEVATDPVTVASLYLDTPYLWGGNSAFGVDCSGLVQASCRACGIPCPGDSDMQQRNLGGDLPLGTSLQRGDLLFWKGHVAWVLDPETILHANAHHMAVAYENADVAIARITAQGEGPVTAHKRLEKSP